MAKPGREHRALAECPLHAAFQYQLRQQLKYNSAQQITGVEVSRPQFSMRQHIATDFIRVTFAHTAGSVSTLSLENMVLTSAAFGCNSAKSTSQKEEGTVRARQSCLFKRGKQPAILWRATSSRLQRAPVRPCSDTAGVRGSIGRCWDDTATMNSCLLPHFL